MRQYFKVSTYNWNALKQLLVCRLVSGKVARLKDQRKRTINCGIVEELLLLHQLTCSRMSLRKRLAGFTPCFFCWWTLSRQLITSEARLGWGAGREGGREDVGEMDEGEREGRRIRESGES